MTHKEQILKIFNEAHIEYTLSNNEYGFEIELNAEKIEEAKGVTGYYGFFAIFTFNENETLTGVVLGE
jgi:hypothetical protein